MSHEGTLHASKHLPTHTAGFMMSLSSWGKTLLTRVLKTIPFPLRVTSLHSDLYIQEVRVGSTTMRVSKGMGSFQPGKCPLIYRFSRDAAGMVIQLR